jgi:hypothetical protein
MNPANIPYLWAGLILALVALVALYWNQPDPDPNGRPGNVRAHRLTLIIFAVIFLIAFIAYGQLLRQVVG